MNPVKELINEIIIYLEKNITSEKELLILKFIKNCPLETKNISKIKPQHPIFSDSLFEAISNIQSKKLFPLKKLILKTYRQLKWKIDDGEYYSQNSTIGTEYINGNMNAELIGPVHGFYKSKELKLGVFLLNKNIFYKDHKHEAPEIYINLSNNTQWRFNNGIWNKKKIGTIIYNKPFMPHGLKVGNTPFLSIWCWPYYTNKRCIVLNN